MNKRWYAIYTRSRYEKRTHALLLERHIEAYLPLVLSWRVWSDRRKQIEIPLMSSYLFVHTDTSNQNEYYNILNTRGVVKFIGFEGRPVPIPERQIQALKLLSKEGIDMQCMDVSPPPGTPVTIDRGPLKGLRGEVVNSHNGRKVIVRIDCIDKCITVNVPLVQLGMRN